MLRSSGKGGTALCLMFKFLFGLVVASFVLLHAVEDVVLENAEDQEEPEEIDCLQTGQQDKGDDLTDPAFVLLGLPVELEGPTVRNSVSTAQRIFRLRKWRR